MTSLLHLDQASSEFYGKRLSLFREFAPRASRVAVLAPATYWRTVYGDALRDAGFGQLRRALGARLSPSACTKQRSQPQRLTPSKPELPQEDLTVSDFTEDPFKGDAIGPIDA
jgi:hypothetical protein